jgi:thermitase
MTKWTWASFLSSIFVVTFFAASLAQGANQPYLVKLLDTSLTTQRAFLKDHGGSLEKVSEAGKLFKWVNPSHTPIDVHNFIDSHTAFIQIDHPIHLLKNPSLIRNRAQIIDRLGAPTSVNHAAAYPDNPDFKSVSVQATGVDPLLATDWGMKTIGADAGYSKTPAGNAIVVAVIDTGIDYNHEDLVNNVWHNLKEIPANNIDDDANGFVDDVIGWDFKDNDNKPYDLSMDINDILQNGGNPGHGTFCSGVVGSSLNNHLGAAGVAPNVKIMGLRFLGSDGSGSTSDAVKAVDYATDMGANIISASWGSEGEDPNDAALREAVQRAGKKGVLFVVAAGNGRSPDGVSDAVGYDNDTDPSPSYPAAYGYPNMLSVAATDKDGHLASFSNYGEKTVQVGAPGVKVLSTVPGNRYQDTIAQIDGQDITWDGTSMATPFVAGALAVLWSQDKTLTADSVKSLLLAHTVALSDLSGKTVTGGRMDLSWLGSN